MIRRLLFIFILLSIAPAWAYNPFDERRQKVRDEIVSDKRLDMKVNVSSKSKNLKDLFAELSAKTGVKLTTRRDVSNEHVIIYFHERPLRDVMTEIAGLYGYHWLLNGKAGEYEYELFEGTRRAARQKEIRDKIKAEQDQLLLDFAEKLATDDKALEELAAKDPNAYELMTRPHHQDSTELVKQFGADALAQALAGNPAQLKYEDLPSGAQTAIGNQMSGLNTEGLPPGFQPTVGLAGRIDEDTGLPRFSVNFDFLGVRQDGGTESIRTSLAWPPSQIDEAAMSSVVGRPVPEKVIGKDSLTDEKKITIDKLRWLPGKKGLLLGDLLEGIAAQTGQDVIADYYLQNESSKAVRAQPLKQVVEAVCTRMDYTCQADGKTLRFRYNKWFDMPPIADPPAEVVDRLWTALERTGQIAMPDLLSLAPLTDEQMQWPGFKFLPSADSAGKFPDVIRFWATLTPEQEALARGDEGLPGARLTRPQQGKVSDPVADGKLDPSQCKIVISNPEMHVSEENGQRRVVFSSPVLRGTAPVFSSGSMANDFESISISMPDTPMPVVAASFPIWPPISEAERKEIAAQRKSDAEAEKVEVAQ